MEHLWLCAVLLCLVRPSFGKISVEAGYTERLGAHLPDEQVGPGPRLEPWTAAERKETGEPSDEVSVAGPEGSRRHSGSRLGLLKILGGLDAPGKPAARPSLKGAGEVAPRIGAVIRRRRRRRADFGPSDYGDYYQAYPPYYPDPAGGNAAEDGAADRGGDPAPVEVMASPDMAGLGVGGGVEVGVGVGDWAAAEAGHEWGSCDAACGIGYQRRPKVCYDQPDAACSGEEGTEVRRCLGIDCADPQALEEKLACRGGPLMIVGIVVGMAIVVVLIGAGCIFTKLLLPKLRADKKGSSSKKKRKKSKKAPEPPPRPEKTKGKGGESSDEHFYEEIDALQTKRAKSNSYVTMTSRSKGSAKKKKKGLFGSKKKQKVVEMSESEEDDDHGYVEPDEINQPGSEELEIENLREPPPPPGSASKRKSPKQKGKPSEYEEPVENDYMEIE